MQLATLRATHVLSYRVRKRMMRSPSVMMTISRPSMIFKVSCYQPISWKRNLIAQYR